MSLSLKRRSDYDLIGRSLHDEIRSLCARFDSGFDLIKQTAMENGALGSGISGSGPSIFALSKEKPPPNAIAKAMSAVYDQMKLP
jgi:homoserine kinase